MRTLAHAVSCRCLSSSSGVRCFIGLVDLLGSAISMSWAHSPLANAMNRRSSSAGAMKLVSWGLCRSITDNRPNSFQARSSASRFPVAVSMASRATRCACRYLPRAKPGHVLSARRLFRNSARRLMPSSASQDSAGGSAGSRSLAVALTPALCGAERNCSHPRVCSSSPARRLRRDPPKRLRAR